MTYGSPSILTELYFTYDTVISIFPRLISMLGKSFPVAGEPGAIVERINFSGKTLGTPGMYRLVYVAQSVRFNHIGILGVSPPFPGHYRTT